MRYLAKAVLVAAVVLFPSSRPRTVPGGHRSDASGAVLPGVTVEAASPCSLKKSARP